MQLAGLFLALVCLGSCYELLSAENHTAVEIVQVPELPTCSLPCFHVALGDIKCPHGNTTCACGNLDMQISIQACSRSLCSIYDSLETHKYLDNVCGQPDRDQGTPIRVLCWLGLFLTTVSVVVRVSCKIFDAFSSGLRIRPTVSSLTLDDLFLVMTYVASVPVYVIVGYVLVDAGLGRDVWTLETNRIDSIGYWIYVFEPLYILIMTLLKTSFLLFFLRIFCRDPSERTCIRGLLNLRLALWSTVIFNAACGFCFILTLIFQCNPISYTWTRWPGDGDHSDGSCINIKAVVWVNGALSVILNAWMLYLPLSQLHGMNLPRRKQIIIGVMFGLGAFVSVVSVLRLQGLNNYGYSVVDPTWDYYPSVIWSVLEFTVGILCACLSAARGVLLRSTTHGSRLFSDNPATSSNTRASKLAHLNRVSFHNRRKSHHQQASADATGTYDKGYQSGSSRLAFTSDPIGMEQFPEITDIESRPVLLRRDSSYRDMTEPAPVSEALKDIIRETTRTSLELSPMREEFIEALRVEDSVAPNADNGPTARKGTENTAAAGGRRTSVSTKKRRITPDFFFVPALTGGVGSSWRTSMAINNTKRGRAMSSPRSPPRSLFHTSDWSQPISSSVTELASPSLNQTKRERNGSVASSIQKPN
ncbi:uncharacterized protein PpBr36_09335 [Pyricularia pennisetigena]|uniref:uncharacterized protein n=1 Tax=Pyricularia pennisetigena TaxID=1578925 RepID=UPI001152EC1D|nr:uncharacterized protein PpBr36_09335 [Pyricularia pennisetigena]TLS22090.1 hypothetical protein PpBr36_09335 [Pyricularia pennisetigena]